MSRDLDQREENEVEVKEKSREELSKSLRQTVDQLDELEKLIEDVENLEISGSDANITKEDISGKTVKELREFLKEEEFSEGQLRKILELEEESKDRKTAKSAIKKKLDEEKPSNLKGEILDNIKDLKEDLKPLKAYSNVQEENIEGSEGFEEQDDNLPESLKDSNLSTDPVKLTERLLNKLRTGELEQSSRSELREAIEEFERGNYLEMCQKLDRIGMKHRETGKDLETAEKLEKMEKMVQNLEKREEKIEADTDNELRDAKNNLKTANRRQSRNKERDEKIEDLKKQGFNEEKLSKQSNSDLEYLEKTSGSVDKVEDIFSSIEEKKDDTQESEGQIEENIDELENIVEDEEDSSDSSLLEKMEKEI